MFHVVNVFFRQASTTPTSTAICASRKTKGSRISPCIRDVPRSQTLDAATAQNAHCVATSVKYKLSCRSRKPVIKATIKGTSVSQRKSLREMNCHSLRPRRSWLSLHIPRAPCAAILRLRPNSSLGELLHRSKDRASGSYSTAYPALPARIGCSRSLASSGSRSLKRARRKQ